MADSDDEVPILDLVDDEADQSKIGNDPQDQRKAPEIPNYRGKRREKEKEEKEEKEDSKANLQINWDADEIEDSEVDESEDEEPDDGAVGEEFARARREAQRQRREKRLAEEEGSDGEDVPEEEELWNFPIDKDEWDEDDLGEEWADPWPGHRKTGFDPDLVEDWDEVEKQLKQGTGPPVRPYYVPYRKHYPLIPEDHPDIQTPQDVVHELERYEEFLVWRSFIFKDGSAYEGTVFDDQAHGKGVYTTAFDLSKYEGEWFQNAMEGHGVLEVDIPVPEPSPDSEEAKKLRAQGQLLNIDFLNKEEEEWIQMDLEDKMLTPDEVIDPNPMEENEGWLKQFGEMPEKGHYRYAGQWKHSRMHGCGALEVNGQPLYGKFYFGELLLDEGECNEEEIAFHSGLAEIAAAKARMFINKPDGMVREARGPYTDPQHPYMYEEEDLWMAPGFINAFYPVPEAWTKYVREVDEEQEMWLNSFIKSPFRIPMPAELEYQWSMNDEFILLSNRDSNSLLQYPENLNPDVEGEILLHTPTGNLINWIEDDDGNLRFFIQPWTEDGVIRPEKAVFLPLGFDEYMGIVDEHGNVLDESRRGLSLEERKKLEEEDKKKEKKERFEAKLEEFRQKARDKIKDLETELYIRKLERKLEDLELEEVFKAELEAAMEEDEDVAYITKDETSDVDGQQKLDDSKTIVAADERPVEEKQQNSENGEGGASGNDDEQEDDGNNNDDDDENDDDDDDGDDDDDDDNDKKPRSFGTVAMVLPGEKRSKDTESRGSSEWPLPTIFASLSLVPQMAAKHVLESSICFLQKSFPSHTGGNRSNMLNAKHPTKSPAGAYSGLKQGLEDPGVLNGPISSTAPTVQNCVFKLKSNMRCPKLCLSSSGVKFPVPSQPLHRSIPASKCSPSALKSCSRPPTKSVRASRSHCYSSRPYLSKSQEKTSRSFPWVIPQMEVLSLALPVKIL